VAKINARNKGKSGEYEVIKMLQTICDDVFKDFYLKAPLLRRNTAQYADGGEDVAGLTWHSIEVKRCEKLEIGKWWLQATRQAEKAKIDMFKLEILENCPISIRKIIYEKFGEFRGFGGSLAGLALDAPANNMLSTTYPDLWTDCGQIVDKCGLVGNINKHNDRHQKVSMPPDGKVAPANKNFSVSPGIICQNLSPFELDKKCPCLLYRQNKARWNAVLWARLPILGGSIPAPCEVSEEVFVQWFRVDLRSRLLGIFGELQ
jgi:hypothetical protein